MMLSFIIVRNKSLICSHVADPKPETLMTRPNLMIWDLRGSRSGNLASPPAGAEQSVPNESERGFIKFQKHSQNELCNSDLWPFASGGGGVP